MSLTIIGAGFSKRTNRTSWTELVLKLWRIPKIYNAGGGAHRWPSMRRSLGLAGCWPAGGFAPRLLAAI